ncbi:MAG: hypothetical protein ACLRHD_13850, partial [Thomasclavelia spiroformis]
MRWRFKSIVILIILLFSGFNFLKRFKSYDIENKLFVISFAISILLFILSQFQNSYTGKVGIYVKRKWYLQTWFICILFMFWPFIIPGILGVVFLILQVIENNKLGKKYGAIDSLDNKISDLETKKENIETSNAELSANWNSKIDNKKAEYNNLCDEINVLEGEALCQHYCFTDYNGLSSEECKNNLAILKLEEQNYIKNSEFIKSYGNSSKKMLNANAKQILRCFNSECD